jgi:hypothetical protein
MKLEKEIEDFRKQAYETRKESKAHEAYYEGVIQTIEIIKNLKIENDRQENFEKSRQGLLDNCEVKMVDTSKLSGQQVSVIRNLVSIKCKDLDIEIICGYHKSMTSNKETARLIMKRAIETIIE